jgi:hypothetical protein
VQRTGATQLSYQGNRDPLVSEAHLSPDLAAALRTALEAGSAAAWRAGDLLVRAVGRAPVATGGWSFRDGSQQQLAVIADALGIGVGAVASWRVTSTAWPVAQRRTEASWTVHRYLAAHLNRVDLMTRFLAACRAEHVTPGRPRLITWLADGETLPHRRSPITVLSRAIARVEADAAQCDPIQLVRLANRLDAIVAPLRGDRRLVAVG